MVATAGEWRRWASGGGGESGGCDGEWWWQREGGGGQAERGWALGGNELTSGGQWLLANIVRVCCMSKFLVWP